ncbi:hypothetical protein HKT37_19050, partial [Pseudomonas aeruginosa]|nr:hypothetical protein [Pseudomonas aeruginosa]
MSRVLFLLLAMVLAGLGQPTLAAPLPDELPAALPAAPPVEMFRLWCWEIV